MYIASIAALLALFGALIAGAGVGAPNRRQGLRMPRVAPESSGRNERGEGVISAAIAVLIIASLGALMWVGFKTLWENAEETTNSEIAKIGK
ncbi:hypothetical protein [Candidatus Poriferisodalis sp.]|uniref:hypothetical protein n=1 Tax=Candidatus Poriferisodalis sp. TaxID=3101277 RepID=UPI003B02AFAE